MPTTNVSPPSPSSHVARPPRQRDAWARWGGLALRLLVAWLVMTTTHEVGHWIGGWASGAKLVDWSLAPWRLPYSLHVPDPRPLVTLWCGPLLGILLPAAAAALVRRPLGWFVADFCLLANGSYLALAWWSGESYLDTARLLAAGTPPWLLATFCLLTIVPGYIRFRNDCVAVLSPR
jgi:hypothetical protein